MNNYFSSAYNTYEQLHFTNYSIIIWFRHSHLSYFYWAQYDLWRRVLLHGTVDDRIMCFVRKNAENKTLPKIQNKCEFFIH